MLKKVKLPILKYSEETSKLEELGLDSKNILENAEVAEITFYNIDAISSHIENDKEYTLVYSNGVEFVCDMFCDEVEQR